MKNKIRIFLGAILMFSAIDATAGDLLICDIQDKKQRLDALTKARKQLELKNIALEKKYIGAARKFNSCANQKWRFMWTDRMKEAEDIRAKIEQENARVGSQRKKLAKLSDYSIEYCQAMTGQIFHGYAGYQLSIDGYIKFLNSTTEMCEKGDFRTVAAEIVLKTFKEATDKFLDGSGNAKGVIGRKK